MVDRIPTLMAWVTEFAQQFRVFSETREEALGSLQLRYGHSILNEILVWTSPRTFQWETEGLS